jgi:hypothetical protein
MRNFYLSLLLLSFVLFLLAVPANCETGASDGQGRFDLVAAPTADALWDGIKYDRFTGETWKAVKGNWVRIEEKELLPKSLYKIIMIPLKSDFEAIRMDLRSGESWRLHGGSWQPMD